MKRLIMVLIVVTSVVSGSGTAVAQRVVKDTAGVKGESRRTQVRAVGGGTETVRTGGDPDDSVYVFESPTPLSGPTREIIADRTSFLIRLMISGNGYGLGLGYAYDISSSWGLFADLAFSGARNTSELELQDPYTLVVYVPNKVNRLFIAPLCMGMRYDVPKEYVAENIAPYLSFGAGASAVIRAPYDPFTSDVFSSFGYSTTYVRPTGFVGAGIMIENTEKSFVTLDARYYVIPFGGEGLESIRGKPMKDFNGVFISLALGFR
ncbi:MAG: hypothetical protein ACKOBV_07240, partial [Candidatus Kapaibacterium sp.]